MIRSASFKRVGPAPAGGDPDRETRTAETIDTSALGLTQIPIRMEGLKYRIASIMSMSPSRVLGKDRAIGGPNGLDDRVAKI